MKFEFIWPSSLRDKMFEHVDWQTTEYRVIGTLFTHP